MPKIKGYNRLEPLRELGSNAELFLDSICFDVSNMNVKDMMIIYEPEITKAETAILSSELAGNWKWNRDRRKWEGRG